MKTNPKLAGLDRAVGTWTVVGSHPALAGRKVPGRVTFERIEGGAFVRMHTKMDDPVFPEGVAIIGTDDDAESGTMIYFDERQVSRRYDLTIHEDGFTWSRDSAKLAQRFRVKIAKDGNTMHSEGTMKKAGSDWEPDLELTYSRVGRDQT